MTPDLAFELTTVTALLGWMLLVAGALVPVGAQQRWLLLAGARAVPLLLSAAYLALLVRYWGSAPGGSFTSLQGVATLFASAGKLAGGWTHFLAFDLFVGGWMVADRSASSASRWILLPCLPLTFLYGPAGLLMYFGLRALRTARSVAGEPR